ncbi:hypothetical protein RZS08_65325, partial [Arthrospira platensis SPKY1]|nr:hypothetical protein [Arthrospira platensis SPKY1]
MQPSPPHLALALALAGGLALAAPGCAQPECTVPRYDDPECRVLAENELARLDDGAIELAFRDPDGMSPLPWDAL